MGYHYVNENELHGFEKLVICTCNTLENVIPFPTLNNSLSLIPADQDQ